MEKTSSLECEVLAPISKHCVDIASGVHVGTGDLDVATGEQETVRPHERRDEGRGCWWY